MRRTATAVLIALVALALPSSAAAWPTWGNLESGDCAFAAAANWEMLHGGTTATEAQVLAEYKTASPNDEGISGDELEAYWRDHGIAGRRVVVHAVTPENLRRRLRHFGPIIAELAVTPGQRWQRLAGDVLEAPAGLDRGPWIEDAPGGTHYAVVRSVDRRGPVLLTWGKLAQLTWWQWQEDALLLYLAY